jgi:DNA-binding response OmpR family regulator
MGPKVKLEHVNAGFEAGGEAPQFIEHRHSPVRLVLLVEDEELIADGLVAMLAFEGIAVDVAATGMEAIERIRVRRPDFVILDVGLPDLTGLEVYARIRGIDANLPVIFSTGSAADAALCDKNVTSLMKPYDTATLLSAARRLLDA